MAKTTNGRKKRSTFRKRNHAAEYAARIAKAEREGRSKASGRGHSPERQKPVGSGGRTSLADPIERAAQLMRSGSSLSQASRELHVSRERLRNYVAATANARYEGRRWVFDTSMAICSNGRVRWITVGPLSRSELGKYWRAVSAYLGIDGISDDGEALMRFVGMGVRDVRGRFWPFETGLNTLSRLDTIGELTALELYRNAPSEG